MFKKRVVKGQKRVIARESSGESSDSESETIVKKQKTVRSDDANHVQQISERSALTELTHNDAATKVDVLNQEPIEADRQQKQQPKDEDNHNTDRKSAV